MKRFLSLTIVLLIIFASVAPLTSCIFTTPNVTPEVNVPPKDEDCTHEDEDKNDYCDKCDEYLIVVIDFYVFNFADSCVCVGAAMVCIGFILSIYRDFKSKKEGQTEPQPPVSDNDSTGE